MNIPQAISAAITAICRCVAKNSLEPPENVNISIIDCPHLIRTYLMKVSFRGSNGVLYHVPGLYMDDSEIIERITQTREDILEELRATASFKIEDDGKLHCRIGPNSEVHFIYEGIPK